MAEWAVRHRTVSIRLACRTFCISETCYRYQPKLGDENEQIADLLLGLSRTKRAWGLSDLLCMSNLVHASKLKEHDDNDDFQGTTGRAA